LEDRQLLKFDASSESRPSTRTLRPWISWLKFGLPVLALCGFGGLIWGAKKIDLAKLLAIDRPQDEIITQPVERKTLPVIITSDGMVQTEQSIDLAPKTAGILKTLLVKEGDRVRLGQVIARMDDSNLRKQLANIQVQLSQKKATLQRLSSGNRQEEIIKAEANLKEVQANLQKLQSGNRLQEIAQSTAYLQQARATLTQREMTVKLNQQLYQAGKISRQSLDQKLTDRDVAKSLVLEAEQVLNLRRSGTKSELVAQTEARVKQQSQIVAALKTGNRSKDIEQATAQVQATQDVLETIQKQIKATQLAVPFDGIVIKKHANPGALISPGDGGGSRANSASILTLASNRNQVVVNLPEAQTAKVKLGQSVTIKADAFPTEKFMGKVEKIASQATVAQNVTGFEVQVAITKGTNEALELPAAEQLRSGMKVEAEFVVGRLENKLFVPDVAVVRQATGKGVYVLRSADRKPVFQPIETGVTIKTLTEVKSGLQGNEQVLVSPLTRPQSDSGK
jgi:HlyD family secretion protein